MSYDIDLEGALTVVYMSGDDTKADFALVDGEGS